MRLPPFLWMMSCLPSGVLRGSWDKKQVSRKIQSGTGNVLQSVSVI